MKSGNLNFLEPSGPLQTCNGTTLPLPFTYSGNQVQNFQENFLVPTSRQTVMKTEILGYFEMFGYIWWSEETHILKVHNISSEI